MRSSSHMTQEQTQQSSEVKEHDPALDRKNPTTPPQCSTHVEHMSIESHDGVSSPSDSSGPSTTPSLFSCGTSPTSFTAPAAHDTTPGCSSRSAFSDAFSHTIPGTPIPSVRDTSTVRENSSSTLVSPPQHPLQDTAAQGTPVSAPPVTKRLPLDFVPTASVTQFVEQIWPNIGPDTFHDTSMTIRVYKRLERLQPNLCAFFETVDLLIHSCKASAYTPDVDNPQLFQVLKRLLVHAHLLSTPGYAQNLEVNTVANELLQIQEQLSQLLPNLTDSTADEAGVSALSAVPGAIERDREESHTAKRKVGRNRDSIGKLFGHHKIRPGDQTRFELQPGQIRWIDKSVPIAVEYKKAVDGDAAENKNWTVFEGEIIEGRHAGERVHIKEFTEIECGMVEEVLLRTVCFTHFLRTCENIARPKYVVPSLKVVVMDPIMHLTLDKFLQPGVLTLAQKIDVALKVAGALALVHAANIVHRNIRPANIIMTAGRFEDGRMECVPKLTGFELCRYAGLDFSLGPRNWTIRDAPEKKVHGSTFQTDVYAFGIMLYEIALGELPRAADGAEYWSVKLVALVHHDYANLMRECVDPIYDRRPEMKVVAERLAQIASELSNQ